MLINEDLKKMKKKFNFIYCFLMIAFLVFLIIDYGYKENGKESTIFLFFALIFYMLIFITAFINNVKLEQSKNQLLISAFCFLPNVLYAILIPYIKLDIIICLYFTTNLVFGLVALICYANYNIKHSEDGKNIYDVKILQNTIFAIFVTLIICSQKTYVEPDLVFIYALYITLIIFAIYSILTLTVFRNIYTKWLTTKQLRITAFACVLVCSFIFTVPALEVINITNQTPIAQTEYVILGKKVQKSGKDNTYLLCIKFENKLLYVKVPYKTYKNKLNGDTIKINFYNGNLNMKYYNCEDWETTPEFN